MFKDGYGAERKLLIVTNTILSPSIAFGINALGHNVYDGIPSSIVKVIDSAAFPMLLSWCSKRAYEDNNISELEAQIKYNVIPNVVFTGAFYGLLEIVNSPRPIETLSLSVPAFITTGFFVHSARKGKPIEKIVKNLKNRMYIKVNKANELYYKYVNL